uniref:argininosuccinate synthase n=1 Tax=Zea mays TaxID=4577 RepID=A0A804ULM7_MAIZE
MASARGPCGISVRSDFSSACLIHKAGAPSNSVSGVMAVQVHRHRNKVRNGQAIRCAMATGKEQGAISTASSGDQTKGGLRGKLNKVVLAYSGGLDTSVIVPWLRENYGCEVVCFTADVGQAMVDVAKEVGADAVAHGCTGKGNDQVRFELTFYALNPELKVVAPWREWDITGREDAIEYAKKHNVPVPVSKKSIYSRDRNLWHLSHEGDILEDPANEPKEDMYMMSIAPENAPSKPEYLEIGIIAGVPVSINGRDLSPASLLAELNEIGGKHGIGRIDMVENRLVGMKSRGVYETPGGTIMAAAVRELESLTLDRETMQWKDIIALKYAELVYAGRWFDPLRQSFDAFMEKVTATTTGSVTLKLYKGSVNVASRKSPYSLYREDISSFENGEIYNQADAEGFIRLYGLPTRVRAMLEKGI